MITVTDILIAADHPAFAGHFPDLPIVPGVVLLDEVLSAIATKAGVPCDRCILSAVKFKAVVRPGQALTLRFEFSGPDSVRFELDSADQPVATGTIVITVPSGAIGGR